MTRCLFYLNALLLLTALLFGMRLRTMWTDARERAAIKSATGRE